MFDGAIDGAVSAVFVLACVAAAERGFRSRPVSGEVNIRYGWRFRAISAVLLVANMTLGGSVLGASNSLGLLGPTLVFTLAAFLLGLVPMVEAFARVVTVSDQGVSVQSWRGESGTLAWSDITCVRRNAPFAGVETESVVLTGRGRCVWVPDLFARRMEFKSHCRRCLRSELAAMFGRDDAKGSL